MVWHLRIFWMLLAVSAALTLFTASMVSSSMGVSIFPSLCKRNGTANTNATVEDTNMSKIDYNDVDFLSYDLEHQIIELLGDEKDSVHDMEDIYPGRSHGSFGERTSPHLRYNHCQKTRNRSKTPNPKLQ
jgi:hypothetical protein